MRQMQKTLWAPVLNPGSDDEDGSGSEDSDDESRFEKGTPRGKRFEDKEAKKVRLRLPFLFDLVKKLTCDRSIRKQSRKKSEKRGKKRFRNISRRNS